MSESNKLTDDPNIFTFADAAVTFAGGDEGEKKKLRLTLYDGSVVPHWYWGNLAFDQSTMKMAKGRNPILFNHDSDKRVAFSDRTEFEPKFVIEGRFLTTSTVAGEVKSQMAEGFPFEASLSFDPERSKVEFIKAGETGECNGRTVKGPGTIVRNALIREGSVCVFGALKNTKSQAFAANPFFKETAMSENANTKMTVDELTAENFAAECPELHGAIVEAARADAIQAEKTRFAELKEACGEDAGLIVQCFAEGKSVKDALKLRAEKAEASIGELTKKLGEQSQETTDPAVAEFRNAPAPGTGGTFDEKAATDEQLEERFAKTPDLQDKFSCAGAYIASVRHP